MCRVKLSHRQIRNIVLVSVLLALQIGCNGPIEKPAGNSNETRTVKLGNKPERLEWLQDAGFGMFVHWSMDSQVGSVISHSMVGASDAYMDKFVNELPKTFNPKRYDPEEWVVLAKLAGMKHVVFSTKHHSGFCMWDTKTTNFNIMNTAYGRDVIPEYVKACRKHGLGVGFYYSPEDFLYLYKHGYRVVRKTAEDPDNNKEYADFIRAQCTELMTKYGPIDIVFIDGRGKKTAKEVFWGLQPDILITRGAIKTPEQKLSGIPSEGIWEACMTMGTQWQYKPTNEEYKSGTRLIEILIETRAKGGALLLDVGPKPDGTLPIEAEERLREIALWNMVNSESVHDVRPWIVTNEGNIWFTKNKDTDTLYAFITKIPDWRRGTRKDFVLKSVLSTTETKVDVLGQSSTWVEYNTKAKAECRWEQKEDGLHVSIVRAQRLYNNSKWPNPVVIKITNVKPSVRPGKVETLESDGISKEGVVILKAKILDMGGSDVLKAGFQYRPYAGFTEELEGKYPWKDTDFIEVNKAGEYKVKLEGLTKGPRYQYRAVIKHPRVTVCGDVISK